MRWIEDHAMNWIKLKTMQWMEGVVIQGNGMGSREPTSSSMHIYVLSLFLFMPFYLNHRGSQTPSKKGYEPVLNLVSFFHSHTYTQKTHTQICCVHNQPYPTNSSPHPQALFASSLAENTHALSCKTEHPVWKNVSWTSPNITVARRVQ